MREHDWTIRMSFTTDGVTQASIYKDTSLLATGIGADESEAILRAAMQLNGVMRLTQFMGLEAQSEPESRPTQAGPDGTTGSTTSGRGTINKAFQRVGIIIRAKDLNWVSMTQDFEESHPGSMRYITDPEDRKLAMAIEVIGGNGLADDSSTEGYQVEDWILWTDSQGFRHLMERDEYGVFG